MNPAEERSEEYARTHRSAEAAMMVEHRAKLCRKCLWCDDQLDDRIVCAKAAAVLYLTCSGSCPIKIW
jgi:hypothetical protein